MVSLTDSLGVTTTRTFNSHNQLTQLVRPTSPTASITTTYGYDAADRITRATDGNNNPTVYTLNSWGLPESTIEPTTAQTPNSADRTFTAGYTARGETHHMVKPGGVTITNTHDTLGNLTKQHGTGGTGTTPDRLFEYDSTSRLTAATNGSHHNTYTYDDRGHLLTAAGPSGSTSLAYGGDGNLTSSTTDAGTTSYTYNPRGNLATAADPLTGVTSTYTYDDAGRLTTTNYGTGASRTHTYDHLNRLTQDQVTAPGGTTTASIAYTYDTEDRLTSKTTTGFAGASANTYTYDDAGRLTSWNNGSATTNYEWDPVGNLTRDGPNIATYNERNHLLTKGTTSYTYTPRGTQASRTHGDTTTNLSFNAFDELAADGATTNTYDALGRLTGSGSASLTYLGQGNKVTSDGVAAYSYTSAGTLLGHSAGGVASAPVTDLHTDLVGLINPTTGALAGSRTYTPFGIAAATAGTQPALGYQHQYTDPGTGNVNMGVRWHDPSASRFTSRDTTPLDPRDTTNANRHAYTASNPLTQTDPTGRIIFPLLIPVVAAVGAAIVGSAAVATIPRPAVGAAAIPSMAEVAGRAAIWLMPRKSFNPGKGPGFKPIVRNGGSGGRVCCTDR